MTEQLNWTELAWGHLESHYRGLSVHWGQMPQTSLTDRRGPEKVTATSLRPPLQLPPLHPRRGGDCLFDSRGASQLKSCERRAGEGGEAHPLGQAAILRQLRDKNRYQNNPAFSPLFQTSHLCPTKGEANTWIPLSNTHTSFQQGLQGTEQGDYQTQPCPLEGHSLMEEAGHRRWRTGRPGGLQSIGSQRVGHNLATEQQREGRTPEVMILGLVQWTYRS